MAKLTDKTALTDPASGDLIHVVDVSDTSENAAGSSKKVAISDLPKGFLDRVFYNLKAVSSNIGAGGDDTAAINAGLSLLPSDGGVLLFPPGNYKFTSLTIPDRVVLMGSMYGTRLEGTDKNAVMFATGDYSGLCGMRVKAPYQMAQNCLNNIGKRGLLLRDIAFESGGQAGSGYMVNLENFFNACLQNIRIYSGMNGLRLATNASGVYNYGNSTFDQIEIAMTIASRIGIDIDATLTATKSINICNFGYVGVIASPGTGGGSTGVRIRNSSWLNFNLLDIEGADTSLDIQGAVSGGMVTTGVNINTIYADNDVNIDAASRNTTFGAGRIFGTITNNQVTVGRETTFGNTVDTNGYRIS
jgi:hypothetical protein